MFSDVLFFSHAKLSEIYHIKIRVLVVICIPKYLSRCDGEKK